MRFSYKDEQIRLICEDSDEAQVKLGTAVAFALLSRLFDLQAAVTIADLIVGNPEPVVGKPYSTFKVDLAENIKLFFRADHSTRKPPMSASGDIDWPNVNYVQIIEIR